MKKIKIILLILALVSFVYIIISNVCKGNILNIFLGVTGSGSLFIGLYNEVDYIFIVSNKVFAWFRNETISVNYKYQVNVKSDQLKNVFSELDSTFNKLDIKIKPHSDVMHEELKKCTIIFKDNLTAECMISNNNYDQVEAIKTLVLSLSFQVSYRDSKNTWNHFKGLQNRFFMNYSTGSEPRYDLTIKTSPKVNPIYKLNVKQIDVKNVEKFNLTFNEGSVRVKTQLNQLFVSSTREEGIINILNKYLAITNVF